MKLFDRILIYAAATIFCLCIGCQARSQGLETQHALVCNTQEHFEMFVSLQESGATDENAHREVTECESIEVAFVRGREVGTMHVKDAAVHVFEVLVFYVKAGDTWLPIKPVVQFLAYLEPERRA
jgi:hypothetical protein